MSIIIGDLFDVLPTLDAESIDACVTDPPYGIGFMGKEWDCFKPEKARASKMHAITVGAKGRRDLNPNTRGRRQSPAMSPSQIEYNRSLDGQRGFQEWCEKWSREVFRVLKPGAHLVVCGAPRSFHRMTCGVEDAGFEIRDCLSWLYGQGFPKSLNLGDGRGTALKPAWEPCVLARKPVKGTVAANVQSFTTGALNVDACRIAAVDGDYDHFREPNNIAAHDGFDGKSFKAGPRSMPEPHDLGRWPSNVLLDEEAAELLDEQTGELVSNSGDPFTRNTDKFRSVFNSFKGNEAERGFYGDSGGASRFFYVAKPSREERDYGTHGLIERQRDESRKAGNPGGDNPRNRGLQPRGNFHPTVKPVELMRWLVRLVTPLGGTVLDPFTGSGTTGMACRYELREFIGIEREAEYVQIAEARIVAVAPLFDVRERESQTAEALTQQGTLFSETA